MARLDLQARRMAAAAMLAFAVATTPRTAMAEVPDWPTLGRHEGEIDLDVSFTSAFGDIAPSPRVATFTDADVRVLSVGAGYNVGRVGPLAATYVRVELGSFSTAEERLGLPLDARPAGFVVNASSRGAFLRGSTAAALISGPRVSFALLLDGTIPIGAELGNFSSHHLDWLAGGTNLDVVLTDPDALVHLEYRARFKVGSGVYADDAQHNARASLTNLLRIEAERWLLPWPVGASVGPQFSGDLNEHANLAHAALAADRDPSVIAGDSTRRLSVDVALMPYVHLTEHAALELAYVHTLFGENLPWTRQWSASLRTTF
ncbi:MAG: hypothetical protein EXR75_09250 [Myxococcales bacterium]|nr:hypothetical protein [Myxococcales bacterium]